MDGNSWKTSIKGEPKNPFSCRIFKKHSNLLGFPVFFILKIRSAHSLQWQETGWWDALTHISAFISLTVLPFKYIGSWIYLPWPRTRYWCPQTRISFILYDTGAIHLQWKTNDNGICVQSASSLHHHTSLRPLKVNLHHPWSTIHADPWVKPWNYMYLNQLFIRAFITDYKRCHIAA